MAYDMWGEIVCGTGDEYRKDFALYLQETLI